MYDHTLRRGRKHFCRYYLQAFSTEEILKSHIKDCFKINGKQRIIMPKKGEYVKFKNYERKIKSPFIIYANFESTLAPENNEKQNPGEPYTNKYQKHKFVLMINLVSLLKHTWEKMLFTISLIVLSKKVNTDCSDVMKKHFKEELIMAKEDNKKKN